MTEAELQQYYAENEGFKQYVDRFCRAKGIPVDEALRLKIVENTALSYQGKLKGWTE